MITEAESKIRPGDWVRVRGRQGQWGVVAWLLPDGRAGVEFERKSGSTYYTIPLSKLERVNR